MTTESTWQSWLQVHITKPTWSNHHNIFNDAGVGKKEYRYYKPATKGLDFEGLIDDLKASAHQYCDAA